MLAPRFLLPLVLSQWPPISSADHGTVLYSPVTGEQQQHVFTWTSDKQQDLPAATDATYLQLSVKHELTKRLSHEARIVLEGEEDFTKFDARYTNYKRPQYIVAVQVAEEQDIVETVRQAISNLRTRTHLSN